MSDSPHRFKLFDFAPKDMTGPTDAKLTCYKKESYDSATQAHVALLALIDTGKAQEPVMWLEAYECEAGCAKWHLGHNNTGRRIMEERDVRGELAKGGVVAMMLGTSYDVPVEFALHPQVKAIQVNNLRPMAVADAIPANTRAAIVTDRITSSNYTALCTALKARRIVYLKRTTPSQMTVALRDMLGKAGDAPTVPVVAAAAAMQAESELLAAVSTPLVGKPDAPAPVVNGQRTGLDDGPVLPGVTAPKGAIQKLLDGLTLDWSKPNGELALAVHAEASRQRIPTTLSSIRQAVLKRRREEQRTDVPASVLPDHANVLAAFDDVLDRLAEARDLVERMQARYEEQEKRMADQAAKIALIDETMKALRG